MTTQQTQTWKDLLSDRMPPKWAEEIDTFETQMELRRQDKLEDKVFAELRLRRGAYGQRYDNGFRNDGEKTQEIPFPHATWTKGPEVKWDAPGMQRIKIPYGGMNAEQMEVLADIAEEYADCILHVTTRQDFQLHFISIDDTPDMHRRLASVNIPVREACGNSVRNVTACPLAGVCRDEAFDVTGYAQETAMYFLGHPDVQDFGRKFKVAFSGCKAHPCGLTSMHDLGLIAQKRVVDGVEQDGFELYVGGGLGAVPQLAKLFDEFIPVEELLPLSQAIARVYARLGEKKNRNQARIKFLVTKLGIEEFRRLVKEERATLDTDPAWTSWLASLNQYEEQGLPNPVTTEPIVLGEDQAAFDRWKSTNIYAQRQSGYTCVTIALPLGDITSAQMRGLADVVRTFTPDTIRTTVEQNLLMRWIHEADLPALYLALKALKLNQGGAESIVDITACPGTDTCKLGISSSRGLAGELRERIAVKGWQYEESVKNIRIKVSGCFNSCSQHMVAEIGFYGASRLMNNHRVPHFHLILGGEWDNNASQYGQSLGVLPSKNIPAVVDFLIDTYLKEKEAGEKFPAFVRRVGKKDIKDRLKPLTAVPDYGIDRSFYTDWGDAREYTIGDIGIGECAGEIVTLTDFGVATAESLHFDATLLLEGDTSVNNKIQQAADKALEAMLSAAQALLKLQNIDISNDPETIVSEFRTYFYDTELFFDPYAKGKFASYLFKAQETCTIPANLDRAQQLIEESRLFIEAAHECYARLAQAGITTPATFKKWMIDRSLNLV